MTRGTLDVELLRCAYIAAVDRCAIALRDDAPATVFESHCAVARGIGDEFVRELARYIDTYERVRTGLGPYRVTPSN